jgi:hypothetical protein
MKQKYIDVPEGNERDILESELDPKEISILDYLKSFNRKNMKEWAQKDLWNFSTDY